MAKLKKKQLRGFRLIGIDFDQITIQDEFIRANPPLPGKYNVKFTLLFDREKMDISKNVFAVSCSAEYELDGNRPLIVAITSKYFIEKLSEVVTFQGEGFGFKGNAFLNYLTDISIAHLRGSIAQIFYTRDHLKGMPLLSLRRAKSLLQEVEKGGKE